MTTSTEGAAPVRQGGTSPAYRFDFISNKVTMSCNRYYERQRVGEDNLVSFASGDFRYFHDWDGPFYCPFCHGKTYEWPYLASAAGPRFGIDVVLTPAEFSGALTRFAVPGDGSSSRSR